MGTLLILGPTASGKSALALAVAEKLGGEIVNADSMQVYADLRVLTARPSEEEEARVPHHLFGHVDAAERYSVGRWLKDASEAIAAIRARGKNPIVVGGTGLYFKALTEGLVAAPPAPAHVRAQLQARLKQEGAPALHAALAARDPQAAARLSANDAPRILRALSVLEATGKPLASFAASPPLDKWTGLALRPERAALYAAIDARFAAMLRAGALAEAHALIARGLDASLPVMKAHGLPALIAHLKGEIDLETAAALARRDTRRYAKRQFTWIAHQAPDWPRVTEPALHARLGLALAALKREG
jgi:tRNA dimethylallyltransferase